MFCRRVVVQRFLGKNMSQLQGASDYLVCHIFGRTLLQRAQVCFAISQVKDRGEQAVVQGPGLSSSVSLFFLDFDF